MRRYLISLSLMTEDLSRDCRVVPPTAPRAWHHVRIGGQIGIGRMVTQLLLGKWPLSFPGMAPGDRPPSAARHRLARRGSSLEVVPAPSGHLQRARSPIRVSSSVRMGVVSASSSFVARCQRYHRRRFVRPCLPWRQCTSGVIRGNV